LGVVTPDSRVVRRKIRLDMVRTGIRVVIVEFPTQLRHRN
jgi:hypothetical protein